MGGTGVKEGAAVVMKEAGVDIAAYSSVSRWPTDFSVATDRYS